MKNKIVVLLIMFLSFIIPVSAQENINGAPISKFKELENSSSRVEINSVDENNEFLGNSKFQILDENGFLEYEFYIKDEAFVIEGLEEGTYYLSQADISDTYEYNPEKIKFEVSNSIVRLDFQNTKKVGITGAMSSNSILLIFMGMLDLTILIGVFAYVRKNKIKK